MLLTFIPMKEKKAKLKVKFTAHVRSRTSLDYNSPLGFAPPNQVNAPS